MNYGLILKHLPWLLHKISKAMTQSPYSEAYIQSVNQEISHHVIAHEGSLPYLQEPTSRH